MTVVLEKNTIDLALKSLEINVESSKQLRAAIQLADLLKLVDAGYVLLVTAVGPSAVEALNKEGK